MKVWILRFALALGSLWLITSTSADDRPPLFGPPPLAGMGDAGADTPKAIESPGAAVMGATVERRRSRSSIGRVTSVLAGLQATETQAATAGQETVPSPPARLPSEPGHGSAQKAPPTRLAPAPSPAAVAPKKPAPLPEDTLSAAAPDNPDNPPRSSPADAPGESLAEDSAPAAPKRVATDEESPSPFREEPAKSGQEKRKPGYASASSSPASERKSAGPLPYDRAYSSVGEETLSAPGPTGCRLNACAPSCDSGCDSGCGGGCDSGCDSGCGHGRGCVSCRRGGPLRLFDTVFPGGRDIEVGGWVDQGITTNGALATDRFNGPVTFNDRADEYQMNQLYVFAERVADPSGRGFDVGGRIDLLYGTDHRFTVSGGLEDDWNLGERFYGLALPQAYFDVAVGDLTVRMGHFYTILGYETVTAPDNFFYSHAYTMQYGEPFTHTGLLGMYDLNDCWSVQAGFHRGWDQWEDNNNQLGFLGGVSWTDPCERTSVAFALTTSNEDDAGQNNRFTYSLVLTRQLTKRLQYVLQHDLGYEDDAFTSTGVQDAEWYGLNNYLLYELNPCWSFGVRYEWFADDDGARVGTPAQLARPTDRFTGRSVPGDWQEVTVGLNYKPNDNVIFRSECRWDWVNPHSPLVADGPFNDFKDRHQFLWSTDLIVQF